MCLERLDVPASAPEIVLGTSPCFYAEGSSGAADVALSKVSFYDWPSFGRVNVIQTAMDHCLMEDKASLYTKVMGDTDERSSCVMVGLQN